MASANDQSKNKDHDFELITHRLPPLGEPTLWERFVGALAITTVLGAMILGPLVPMALLVLAWMGFVRIAATLTAVLVATMWGARHSPAWCRWHLQSAGWFRQGVYLHMERRALQVMADRPSMWCMHPHGTSLGFGFSLNGAVRFRAHDHARFVPPAMVQTIQPPERLQQTNGVMAPILFTIPLVRHMLLAFGCCTPATKQGLCGLLETRVDVGILPGGMSEVALYTHGAERVYIRSRAGFIKYALQYGYVVQPAYTFGEGDLYQSLQAGAQFRLWMQQHGGFIIPIFWGPYWGFPWLPRSDVALHTVLGAPLVLPQMDHPTAADVTKYHSLYVQHLTELFETHKARFGYGDRQLEIL